MQTNGAVNDTAMKSSFHQEQLDYASIFNPTPSLDSNVWNLPSDIADTTSPATPTPNVSSTMTSTTATVPAHNSTSPVSIRDMFDMPHASSMTMTNDTDFVGLDLSKPPSPKSGGNNNKPTPEEDEMVRRIHRKVGGPTKLSLYEEPARVRRVVIEALATEQRSSSDISRIRRGQLSASERRVVRTVTNRGAAVRSRMRQRKEMATLRMQVRARDGRVRQLEAVVRALCSAYAVPLPPSVIAKVEEEEQDNIDFDFLPSVSADEAGIGHGQQGQGQGQGHHQASVMVDDIARHQQQVHNQSANMHSRAQPSIDQMHHQQPNGHMRMQQRRPTCSGT